MLVLGETTAKARRRQLGHGVFLAQLGGQDLGELAVDQLGHVGAVAGDEAFELVDLDDHHRQLALVALGESSWLAW
jgi:hypothetical protein